MSQQLPPLPSLRALSPTALMGGGALLPASGRAAAFAQVLADVTPRSGQVQAQNGDTLIGLVKAHYRQNQQPITEQQAMRLAHQVAAHNQIDNPDLILTGQKIDFSSLQMPSLARSSYGSVTSSYSCTLSRILTIYFPLSSTTNAVFSAFMPSTTPWIVFIST